tara:strand:- start:14948 stop:15157 length:210 start_codon:yes stop_codon:yes gene_type:complete
MDMALNDEPARYIAMQTAQWLHEAQGTHPKSPEDLIATAQTIEHYLANGCTVAFDCKDSARKFVRGQTK